MEGRGIWKSLEHPTSLLLSPSEPEWATSAEGEDESRRQTPVSQNNGQDQGAREAKKEEVLSPKITELKAKLATALQGVVCAWCMYVAWPVIIHVMFTPVSMSVHVHV